MAEARSPAGLSIPGSARRKKTYSVSLRDKNLDISEVPLDLSCEEDGDNSNPISNREKCLSCGQRLPLRSAGVDATIINEHSPASQLSHSLPAEFQNRSGYQSFVNSNGGDDSPLSSSLDHCHGSARTPTTDLKARNQLIVASVLCLVFMVGEIVGGYLANSLAIATDAAHLLTDFASFMISLFSLYVASRPPTKKMSFGWYRAEVIGALTSVLMIWVVTGVLVYMAIQRLVNKEFDIDAKIMLITSGIGVAFNIVMGCTLHQHGHSHGGGSHGHSHGGGSHGHSHSGSSHHGHSHSSHSHGHSHDEESQPLLTRQPGSPPAENINVRAAFIHVIGDFVQSLGVFIAALVIFFKPDWVIVDPICTFLFSILVLFTTVAILRDALTVLMEGLPRGLDFNMVQDTFLSIEGVLRVHNLRIWALSMDKTALSAHLAIRPGVNTQQVLLQASKMVRSRFNLFEMTLQVEEFEAGMEGCTQCQDPLD